MKLIRLKLNEPFRSLQAGFELHFLREWDYERAAEFNPYCLVGRNGSGKSNVLEALAAIFYHVECIYLAYKPDDFEFSKEDNPRGFQAENSYPDAFELEYFFPVHTYTALVPGEAGVAFGTSNQDVFGLRNNDMARIQIAKEKGKAPDVLWLNRNEIESDASESRLNRTEVKKFLPTFILGYSSGENEILSLPFFKMRFIHFDEYLDRLTKSLDYMQIPEGRLVYLDKQFSQAILLCNFLMQRDLLQPFEDVIGLRAIEEFQIVIRRHHYEPMQEEYLRGLSEEEAAKEINKEVELTSNLKKTRKMKKEKGEEGDKGEEENNEYQLVGAIEKLKMCSTASYEDPETNTLYLDYWVNDATRKAFRFHFEDALTLFQTFQILLTLNLYTIKRETKKELYQSDKLYVSETIPVPPVEERIIQFTDFHVRKHGLNDLILNKALSDGEHQFLHTLGLCLLFKDQPNLFLLDEPETHFNPDWRASFISRLRECLERDQSKNVMREMLITSHSPFIVSDSREENVLIFEKDDQTNQVSCRRPDFNTFGASVNQITIKIFNKPETIGGYAHSKLKELETRFEDGEDGEKLIKEANRMLGDSVEKILFINRVLDALENKK